MAEHAFGHAPTPSDNGMVSDARTPVTGHPTSFASHLSVIHRG